MVRTLLLLALATATSASLVVELSPEFLAAVNANPTHYGDPASGCKTDEVNVSVQGVPGDMCSPTCTLFHPCPKDVPTGATAKPQCALQDSGSGKKYCALLCTPSEDAAGQCGTGASCEKIQTVGICTYNTTDVAGNLEGRPASRSWDVDLTVPVNSIGYVMSTKLAINWEAAVGVEYRCSLDAYDRAACVPPLVLQDLEQGSHELQVVALTASGDEGEPTTVAWTVRSPISFVGLGAEHDAEWAAWKLEFDKAYESAEEEARRFATWAENKLLVEAHNAAEHGWTMAVNKFADQTAEEFNAWAMGLKPPGKRSGQPFVRSLRGDPPTSVDWRSKNVVNPVKNQEQCGSCWAFSTIASFETQFAIKHGNLTSFSEQDLVDCVKGIDGCCDGCQGGLMDAGFTYLVSKQDGNDDLEANYPYTQKTGPTCEFEKDGPAYGGIKSHTDIKQGDEDGLATAVATIGVISVGVDASKGWQMYSGGVYTPGPFGIFSCSNSPNKMDHGVAVVGYDTLNGKDYWIVRNSWGPTWGNEGYMYLARGKNACGVSNTASYPVL